MNFFYPIIYFTWVKVEFCTDINCWKGLTDKLFKIELYSSLKSWYPPKYDLNQGFAFFPLLVGHKGLKTVFMYIEVKQRAKEEHTTYKLKGVSTTSLPLTRAAKAIFWVNCAHFVKSWRLSTVILIYMNYNFLICHILWHFQDGRHWPWKFHMGQKLKHAPISLKIVSNCLSGNNGENGKHTAI